LLRRSAGAGGHRRHPRLPGGARQRRAGTAGRAGRERAHGGQHPGGRAIMDPRRAACAAAPIHKECFARSLAAKPRSNAPMATIARKSLYVLLCSLLPGVSVAQEGSAPRAITPAPAFSVEQLLSHPRESWVTNGGNLYNQRYSPLDQINRGNVAELKAEWRTHLNSGIGPQYSGQAQSLVYEGVLYIVTGANDVFALDVETGDILWEYRANLDPSRVNVCCGWTNRGVAMGDGKIFFGRLDAKFIALDQRTGEVVWEIQAEDPAQGFSITSPPLYYEGMIISG